MNYGIFGGQYVPEELKKILNEIKVNFKELIKSKEFKKQYNYYYLQMPLFFLYSIQL